MTITTYPDGHSIQQGTPEELARFVFEMQALQTLQSFRNLVEAIPAEMGGLKANYPALKEACMEMRQMIMQKTAGQRKDRPKDIPWENWERVKVTIICEAMALVLSGEYEPKEEKKKWN